MQKLSRSALALLVISGLLAVAPAASASTQPPDDTAPGIKFLRSDPAGVFTRGVETSAVVARDAVRIWGTIEDANPDDSATMQLYVRASEDLAWQRVESLTREIVSNARGVQSALVWFEAKVDLSEVAVGNGKIHFLATEGDPAAPGDDSDEKAIRFVKLGSNARETVHEFAAPMQSKRLGAHFADLRARLTAVAADPRLARTNAPAHIHEAIAALDRADAELANVDLATPLLATTDAVLDAREARISAGIDLLASKEARVTEARKARDALLEARDARVDAALDARADALAKKDARLEDARERAAALAECRAQIEAGTASADCLRKHASSVRARFWRR